MDIPEEIEDSAITDEKAKISRLTRRFKNRGIRKNIKILYQKETKTNSGLQALPMDNSWSGGLNV